MSRPRNSFEHDEMEVYQFIRTFILTKHYAPTMKEIVDGTTLQSTSSAVTYVEKLVKLGYLGKTDKIARGIYLITKEG